MTYVKDLKGKNPRRRKTNIKLAQRVGKGRKFQKGQEKPKPVNREKFLQRKTLS